MKNIISMRFFSITLTFLIVFLFLEAVFADARLVSKKEACISPDNYMQEWFEGNSNSNHLEVTGLRNAVIEYYTHIKVGDSYNMLYYVVRQLDLYDRKWVTYDDYSFYQYDCQTKKISRLFWQFTFREIAKYFPIKGYPHAKMDYINWRYVEFSFYRDICSKKNCTQDFYKVSIWFSPHRYTIHKMSKIWNSYERNTLLIKEWTY